MAVVLAATGVFIYERLESNLDRAVNRGLGARAADVAALAQQSDSGLREARGSATGRRPGELAQLITTHGGVLDSTPDVSTRPLMSPAALSIARHSGRVVVDARSAGDQPIRLLAEPVSAQGQRLVVLVGQSLQDRNRALSDLVDVLLLGGPVALLLACVAGYLLTGAALRPVEAMRRRAEEISAASLEQRLPPAGHDELGRLGRTLNEMLARIQASVAREHTFVSEASHELRSPLAMLRTELELIARDRPSGPALRGAVGSAIDETHRLSQLADDLLLLARADNQQLPIQQAGISVIELLHAAADRTRRRAGERNIQMTIDADADVRVWVDRDRIIQALDNLVANAIRYASTRVELTARVDEASVELHVTDDGPGFPTAFLAHAWERFARADAARAEDGTGLGLSIVRAIAEGHGGQAGAANRPNGGADVWMSLPRAGNHAAPERSRLSHTSLTGV